MNCDNCSARFRSPVALPVMLCTNRHQVCSTCAKTIRQCKICDAPPPAIRMNTHVMELMMRLEDKSLQKGLDPNILGHFASAEDILILKGIYNTSLFNFLRSLMGIDPELPVTIRDVFKLRDLRISGEVKLHSLDGLEFCIYLESLSIDTKQGETRKVVDFSPLSFLTGLEELRLNHFEFITTLTTFRNLRKLKKLYLKGARLLPCLDGIHDFGGVLELLDVSYCSSLTDISRLQNVQNLRTLYLSGCSELTIVDSLRHLSSLTELYLNDCLLLSDISSLAGLSNLSVLDLSKCTGVETLHSLPTNLRSLIVADLPRLSSLIGVDHCCILNSFTLCNLENLTSISSLGHFSSLSFISISSCPKLSEFSSLAQHKNLTRIEISACCVDNLNFIKGLKQLEKLYLENLDKLIDISVVTECQRLRKVRFINCSVASFSPLLLCPNLEYVYVSGTFASDLSVVAGSLQQRNVVLDVFT
ncbi:hypothetical protein RCL1_003531 [Eukaryota sp. TZLM3-RCL]